MSLRGGSSSRRSNPLEDEEIASSLTSFAPRNDIYDIAIIGAGAVGSAIARELSRYALNVVLLEENSDVGTGTSKASTAIWHTGFDATSDSLESKLLKRSYPLMEAFMKEVGSPFELVGGLLIAWNEGQLHTLPALLEKAKQNGDTDCFLIDRDEVYRREPHLGEGAIAGMVVPREGILCTFTIPLACATQAVANGVELELNFRVENVAKEGDRYAIHPYPDPSPSRREGVRARWVINAAGLYSDEINHLFGHETFKITPRRGELIVYDKFARRLVNHVLLPVPAASTKGVLVSPTIYGNVLLGPTAEDLSDKTATNTSETGLNSLLDKGRKILPALMEEEVTATYSGLRAAAEDSDYQIALDAEQRYLCVGGIRSTGISASLGIAEYVVELLKEGGIDLKRRPEFKTLRMPNIGEVFPRPYQRADLIAENPDYGTLICHCERVSLGELKDAMSAPIPAATLDALRRRTRAMQGRCQGFNCQAKLNVILRERSDRRISTTLKETLRSRRTLSQSDTKMADVLIVGAGPAGLAAALELKKIGIRDVVIAERESEAGGIPRLCGHTGFGMRDMHRVMTGPSYARTYREMAERAGIQIATNTTITGWEGKGRVSFTSPAGLGSIEAKSILLATGVRERPRSARLVPGYRPQGIFTTGSLQRFVYEHGLPVGRRAVIVGAEIVSLSVVAALLHAGVRVAAMLTELPRHQLYMPIFLPAKILYADILARTKVLTNKKVVNILGKERVEGVETRDLKTGTVDVIECDTVVFTGDWIPENELARRGEVETWKPSLGPQVDAAFRTSQVGVFAAGNVLRGVETADWAAVEGRSAARSIAGWLDHAPWPANRIEVHVEAPLKWICPNVITESRPTRYRILSGEFRDHVELSIHQGIRLLHAEHFSKLIANAPINLPGGWNQQVDLSGENIRIVVQER